MGPDLLTMCSGSGAWCKQATNARPLGSLGVHAPLFLPALPAETLIVAQAAGVLSCPGRGGHPSKTLSLPALPRAFPSRRFWRSQSCAAPPCV